MVVVKLKEVNFAKARNVYLPVRLNVLRVLKIGFPDLAISS